MQAYELSTLTGTQVLLLVVSETGLVYTFTTPKLQPLVTKPEGKNLIQSCLNAPDVPSASAEPPSPVSYSFREMRFHACSTLREILISGFPLHSNQDRLRLKVLHHPPHIMKRPHQWIIQVIVCTVMTVR